MASTHHRVGSDTSTFTALSDEFERNVQDNMQSDKTTPQIARMARSRLHDLKQNPGRLHRHPSTLIPPEMVDPHSILAAMLDYAPNEGGERYVASAIVACGSEASLHVDLADTWLRYLLLVFKGNSDARRNVEASDHATPTLYDTQVHMDPISDSREKTFRTKILQRDGYRCILSGHYDRHSMQKDFDPGSHRRLNLEASHILKRAVATFDGRQGNSAYATWDIIRNYAHWPDTTLEKMTALIDSPQNGFLLQGDLHTSFDEFQWTLVPETMHKDQVLPHTYRVKVLSESDMLNPFKEVVTFQNCDAPGGLLKVPKPETHSLPDPGFLALHAALAQVLYASGAGEVIDLYMDRSSQHGPAVPSHKIRHGDELALLLSQMEL